MSAILLLQAVDPTRDTLSVWADVAVVGLGALAVVALIAVLVLLLQLRKLGSQVTALARQVEGKVDPVLERSRTIAQNVEYISASVKKEVEQVTGAVRQLSDRLEQASEHMETRIDEFNALMEVVQDEAETQFLDAASAVRGVKASARTLATGADHDGTRSTDPAVLPGPTHAAEAETPDAPVELPAQEREAR